MDVTQPTRRGVLLASVALMAFGLPAIADEVFDIEWKDLMPEGEASGPSGVVEHDGAAAISQPASTGVRTDWNGQTVRLSGFVIPMEYDGTAVKTFMLVPYVGACIHVPPPPANQLVLVTTDRPYESGGLFEPVTVTGMFGAASNSTQLAEVGYALSADRIVPYE